MAIFVTQCAKRPPVAEPQPDWQTLLADAVRDPSELCRLLDLPVQVEEEAKAAARDFPLLVPRTYLARMWPGEPRDPLLLQVLPHKEETAEAPGFAADPLDEAAALCGPGLLRKYKRRLLILASGDCGVHCRFCFRRHSIRGARCGPAWKTQNREEPLEQPSRFNHIEGVAIEAIAADPTIDEIILSGGDPLTLPDDELAHFAKQLAEVRHLQRLRIHTRLPIVIPQRVTNDLVSWLRGTRLTPIVIAHVNHPNEVDDAAAAALRRLVDARVPVLSQSVLLRGVNDDADVLAALFLRLVDLGVMPYYLHQLDRVAGAAHFEVPVERGKELIRELRARLPGYAVPRYVRDTPGQPNKQVLA
jgi:EF-P beta-lysylation protein EpmB